MHFQTWQDKAGNATPLTAVDPVTKVKVTFADLTNPKVGPNLQANLIMPEPTAFLSRNFPVCSIIRPTTTANAAIGAVGALTDDGLFIGQSPDFMSFITQLACGTLCGGIRIWSRSLYNGGLMFEGLFQPMHLLVIAGIALLVFGPKKLPELGKGLGESIRGFKAAMAEKPTDESDTKPGEGKSQS